MAGDKVLVLGATGPAGICLLRELLYRKHATIAYVRNPSKVPQDLTSSHLLEITKGEMNDTASLSAAIAKSYIVLSLIGPNSTRTSGPLPYPGYYSTMFSLMRQHDAKRIMAMSTVSVEEPGDSFSLVRFLLVLLVRLFVPAAYRTMLDIARVFRDEADDLEWTVFRLGAIPGGHDEASWKRDREDTTYAGNVGDTNWKYWARRGGLASWLVDCAEGEQEQWIHKLPAVSNLRDGKIKAN